MSNTVRWVLALFLIVAGLFAAAISLGLFGFFTFGCYENTNTIATWILYLAAFVGVLGGIVPAAMLIRKLQGKLVSIAIAVSLVLVLACNGIFIFYTLNVC